jgi:hypothetical protein
MTNDELGGSSWDFWEVLDLDSILGELADKPGGQRPKFVTRHSKNSSFKRSLFTKKETRHCNHKAEPSKRLPFITISNDTKLLRNAGASKANWHGFDYPKFSELPRIAWF